MDIKRVIVHLKAAAESTDVQRFGELLVGALAEDPLTWLRIIRVQRLVEQFRNAAAVRQLSSMLSNVSIAAQLDKSTHADLIHHITVVEFMQEVYAHIDAPTMALASIQRYGLQGRGSDG